MTPGDVVLVRFPQADLREGKLRPALVVAIAPGRHADVLLALITSRLHSAVPNFDETIHPADADFASTHLKAASVIRLARLVTVESAVVSARLGAISEDRLKEVHSRLVAWLQAPGS